MIRTKTTYGGKTIFVIGGSSGIGLAMARRLAEDGAHVAIFARRAKVLDQALQEIVTSAKASGQTCKAYVLDASSAADARSVLAQAVSDLGVPDVLVNSAGGATPQAFEDVTQDDLSRTLSANVFSVWHPCQVLAPQMKARGAGAIVNVSSVAGLVGVYGFTDYSLAKFAVIGFSEALRSELKPHGVSVQVLCPPDTETPGFERENKTKPAETKAVSEGAKLMSATDVADQCLKQIGSKPFLILANRESRFIDVLRRFIPDIVRTQIDQTVRKTRAAKT